MKKETIKKHVREQFPRAELITETNDRVWFLVDVVSSKSLSWARLPYVQLLPYNESRLLMVVSKKF